MLLEVDDLRINYATSRGSLQVVKGVTFGVDRAEIVGLVGESGSGKSATIRGIMRLPGAVRPTVSGAVRLAGVDLLQLSPSELRAKRGVQIGFVGQNPFASLHPILPIGQQFHNVLAAHRRTSSRADSARVAEQALDLVGIREPRRVLGGYAHQLSGGMAQRTVIAIAASLKPELLIADEPTTALDPTVQIQILDLLSGLRTARGMSILLITHDLGVVAQYCDRALVMRAGEIVEQNSVKILFTTPAHPYTRELLKASEETELVPQDAVFAESPLRSSTAVKA